MAALTTDGIRLSALCPKFLHTNSTSHTWPFSAIAELVDNAYDPDVNAKQIWIDQTVLKQKTCLTFTDNGNGMTQDKLHKMLSFGFSDKVAINGHAPVGLYGNGFKSGSMRLGKDAIVFTKNDSGMHIGMLSQTFLENIEAQHVIVPIISFNKQMQLVKTADSDANMSAILTHSLLATESELLAEINAIGTKKGTRIIIWNLRRDKRGLMEFDFMTDKYDIRIPEEINGTSKGGFKKQERNDQVAPDSDYSLRAYCSILYLRPRMQIVIRGQKVQTQLISKSLAFIEKDVYRPKFLAPNTVKFTFGYNCRNKDHYGIMMYHKNRLIKAYVRVGCQLKANNMGVGIVGIVECKFLQPTHNKQDFDYTNDYRLTLVALGDKLNDYWNAMKEKMNSHPQSLPVEDVQKNPDQTWAQCDSCLKWRKLPDAMRKLPAKWYCSMNPDPQFRDCSVPEEPEDEDEITHPTYEKTPKRRKSDQLQQVFQKGTILFTPPSKEMQAALNHVQTHYKPGPSAATLASTPEAALQPGAPPAIHPSRRKRLLPLDSPPVPVKKPPGTIVETIELPDGDDIEEADDGDVIIIEHVSTPKPKIDNSKPKNSPGPCPVPMDSLDSAEAMVAASTQTTRPGITVKREEDSSNYIDFETSQQMPNETAYSQCNGTYSHADPTRQTNHQHSLASVVDHEKEHYKKYYEELQVQVKSLENQLAVTLSQQVKKEPSDQWTQTDLSSENLPGNSSKQLVSQYEQALREISRLKTLCNTLQDLKCEHGNGLVKEGQADGTSEVDEMALQLDGVFRQLDMCSSERDQCKAEIEQLKQEKLKTDSQNNQLKAEVEKLKGATKQNSPSTSASTDESSQLRLLRVNVAQLLTMLMPDLDLQQIDYDVDVIDEILAQVLEQAEKQANGNE
ncbi:MORC family CW-type zinc finger protein 3 [Mixophyes fleayi]|uniref:MORC family CW-type zinc finger protein 3 n=1 Tax=Mixophyes fleayi TaxID=3061075 RepID=UPI003F4D89F2